MVMVGRNSLLALLVAIVAGASVYAVVEDDSSPRGPLKSTSGKPADQSQSTSTVFFNGDLEADIYRPDSKGPFPAVLLVHGGGLRTGSRSDLHLVRLAEALRARGMLVASIDYTLNEGFEPASRDVREALSWLRTVRDVDAARIAMVGQSAGAGLVAHTAFQDRVEAVVLASPYDFTDIVSVHGSPDDPETLVLRGSNDSLVPPGSVTSLVDQLASARVTYEYRVVEGAGHADTVVVDLPQLVAWLSARLHRSR